MSISEIEEEARKIVEEAGKKAEEILSRARKEAAELKSKPLVNLLKPEERERIMREFELRIKEIESRAEERKQSILKSFAEKKKDLVREIVDVVIGLREL
ncbi:MAG: hypothetical protein QN229_03165 [Desulfurococcaceae archaeon TW002]